MRTTAARSPNPRGYDIGDLNREWRESTAIAEVKPDLNALESEVVSRFKARPGEGKLNPECI